MTRHPRRVAPSIALGAAAGALLALAPAAMAQGDGADPSNTVSLAEAFFIQRNPSTGRVEVLGSLIVWLLLALSAACVGLLGAMALENKRSSILGDTLVDRVRSLLDAQKDAEALEASRADGSDLGAALAAALTESPHGHGAMVRAGEQTLEELVLKRLRRIEPLNIVGNVAPMIGLFGTVYGMILAFREIVAAGGSPDPVDLAAGIGTALTTTFWGLVVAIPALAGYSLLRSRIDGAGVEAARAAEEIVNHVRGRADGETGAEP